MVSILIVNYNSGIHLEDTIQSIFLQRYREYEIIVVDNASTDTSIDFMNGWKNTKHITLIKNKVNVGYCKGNNQALLHARGEYVLLLNPDCTLAQNCLFDMISVLKTARDPKILAAIPAIFQPSGKIDSYGAVYNDIGHYYANRPNHYISRENLGLTACCTLIDRSVFNSIYLFDDRYFMYYEEFDLTIRFFSLGYKSITVPSAHAYHKGSMSISSAYSTDSTLFKQLYANPNRVHIYLKYYPLSVIIRNFHKFLGSILFWEYQFLLHQKYRFLLLYNTRLLKFTYFGIKERLFSARLKTDNWKQEIIQTSISSLRNYKNQLYGRI